MWIGIDTDHKVAFVDERLASCLGYDAVHKAFLGSDLGDFISEEIVDHKKISSAYVEAGMPPLSLTRQNPKKFYMRHRDGTRMKCYVKVQTMEDAFCAGFCSMDDIGSVRVYGMAEVTFIDDLPAHIREALSWYEANIGLVHTVEQNGGLASILGTMSMGDEL